MKDINEIAADDPEAARQLLENPETPELPDLNDPNLDAEDTQFWEAVRRAAKLSPPKYHRIRDAFAEELNVPINVFDKCVSAARKKAADDAREKGWQKLTTHKSMSNPPPWPDTVNGAELCRDIESLARRHMSLSEHSYTALTLYILFSYVVEHFYIAPVLYITSPIRRCGKTTTLDFAGKLCSKSLAVSGFSAPFLYRAMSLVPGMTLLLDEGDLTIKGNEAAQAILNASHRRDTATIGRIAGDDHEPVLFPMWSPRVIAAIGEGSDTNMDRSIIIKMQRKKAKDKKVRVWKTKPENFEQIRARIVRWVSDHTDAIQKEALEDNIANDWTTNDRAFDNWEPLLVIAGLIGKDYLEQAKRAAIVLTPSDNEAEDVQLLIHVFELLDNDLLPAEFGSKELVDELLKNDEWPWSEANRGKPITQAWLTKHLVAKFEIPKDKINKNRPDERRGFTKAAFNDVFDRYLGTLLKQIDVPFSERAANTLPDDEFNTAWGQSDENE